MKVIGITGNIASGKTTFSEYFCQAETTMQIPCFNADIETHKFYETEDWKKIVASFCPEVLTPHGFDRAVLSKIVREDAQLLKKLEAEVHPRIWASQKTFIQNAKNKNAKLVLIDTPLLFERHTPILFDAILLITTTQENRKNRALQRPNMTEDKLDFILGHQQPEQLNYYKADYVIENNADKPQLKSVAAALAKLWLR